MHNINEALLDELLGKLEGTRAWSPRVISKLETLIHAGDDYDLFRINPIRYAAEKGVSENEAIDLFLHSAKLGLFEMEWHLVCPTCGHVVESLRNMHKLHPLYVCNQCAIETTATLDDYIQVAFTISPSVRETIFHHPEALSADDLFFKFNQVRGAHSWLDGWSHEGLLRAVTKLLAYLEPGGKRRLEFGVEKGLVIVTNLTERATAGFRVGTDTVFEPQTISIKIADGRFRVMDREAMPGRVDYGYTTNSFDHLGSLLTGTAVIELENQTGCRTAVWVSLFTGEPPKKGLTFDPFLSGKRLITTQTFRTLFRSETISGDESIGVRDISFLFTDLKGSTALYDHIGDPKAYSLVRQHFEALGNVINRYEGATVKTIGDAVMATFLTPLDAVRAALEMLHDIDTFNRNISDKLILKIGIHTGHSIVVTLNDRLDYFGQTVNIASRVQGLADAGEICISEDVYMCPGIHESLADCNVDSEQVTMKGVSGKLRVYRILAKSQHS